VRQLRQPIREVAHHAVLSRRRFGSKAPMRASSHSARRTPRSRDANTH
jgi:hypothetical protein